MKYIASWSGGKDSTASIILAHENKEPLDIIIFSEVMFNETISGELPEHIEFIHRAKNIFEGWGYNVLILRSDKTYMDCFNHRVLRTNNKERKGKKQGFPMSKKCKINTDCKIRPIKKFLKSINEDYIQYVGIAAEEKQRLERIEKTKSKISLLEKYGYTEKMAFNLCKKYNLLSPVYEFCKRGGCFFCPNATKNELRHLRKNHKDLWEILLELEQDKETIGNMWNTLTRTKLTDLDMIFEMEDRQITLL